MPFIETTVFKYAIVVDRAINFRLKLIAKATAALTATGLEKFIMLIVLQFGSLSI